jgi:hypothetical protein
VSEYWWHFLDDRRRRLRDSGEPVPGLCPSAGRRRIRLARSSQGGPAQGPGATAGTLVRNPATGEMVKAAAKPASVRVKIRALSKLKTAAGS